MDNMNNVEQVKQFIQDFRENSLLVIEVDYKTGTTNLMEWYFEDVLFSEELTDPDNMQPLFNYLNLYNIPYEILELERER